MPLARLLSARCTRSASADRWSGRLWCCSHGSLWWSGGPVELIRTSRLLLVGLVESIQQSHRVPRAVHSTAVNSTPQPTTYGRHESTGQRLAAQAITQDNAVIAVVLRMRFVTSSPANSSLFPLHVVPLSDKNGRLTASLVRFRPRTES